METPQHEPQYACPDCIAGKHHNCDGIGGVDPSQEAVVELPCVCKVAAHPLRRIGEKADVSRPMVDNIPMVIVQEFDTKTRKLIKEEWYPSAGNFIVPEEDPGILGEAFPELTEEAPGPRLRADASVIPDLYDVEVQNTFGIWVPMVPMPIHLWFGFKQCLCGAKRFGKTRYQEHYAYAHILGMAR